MQRQFKFLIITALIGTQLYQNSIPKPIADPVMMLPPLLILGAFVLGYPQRLTFSPKRLLVLTALLAVILAIYRVAGRHHAIFAVYFATPVVGALDRPHGSRAVFWLFAALMAGIYGFVEIYSRS